MPAPEISAFGDGDHDPGATGLVVDGGGFGAFPGLLRIYENSDRTGAEDDLSIGSWNDIQLGGVEIPASPNNAAGTRYLFLQREDLAWSQGFSFTLGAAAVAPAEETVGGGHGGRVVQSRPNVVVPAADTLDPALLAELALLAIVAIETADDA